MNVCMSQTKKEESQSVKAIFINAKDNTISYVSSDVDDDTCKKYIYFGYKLVEIAYRKIRSPYGDRGYWESRRVSTYTRVYTYSDSNNSLSVVIDECGPERAIAIADFGFSFNGINFCGVLSDYYVYYLDNRNPRNLFSWISTIYQSYTKGREFYKWISTIYQSYTEFFYEGSYLGLVSQTKPTPFIGNAIIKTNKSIEELSKVVKCFHIEDKGSGPVIVEYDSNPKIITLDDFLI